MSYERVNWLNSGETGAKPINKTNLNIMDKGISDLDANKQDKINDTGWVSLLPYIDQRVLGRPGHEPMIRKIGKVVYLKGEIYITEALPTATYAIVTNLPQQFVPNYQANGFGKTFSDLRDYMIFVEGQNIKIVVQDKTVQQNYSGFALGNISPYIVD